MRDEHPPSPPQGGNYIPNQILKIFNKLKNDFPNDWLLPLELYELSGACSSAEALGGTRAEILKHLQLLQKKRPEVSHLIAAGLELLKTEQNNN